MPIIRIPARVPRSGKSIKGPLKHPKKGPKKVVQKSVPQRRRESSSSLSSPANLSDDGGYSAVDDLSDSDEDDEEHVYAAEEEHIISDELHHKRGATRSSPRPSSDLDEDEEGADADDDDSDDNETNTPHKARRNLLMTDVDPDNDVAIHGSSSEDDTWDGLSNDDEQPPYPADITGPEQSGTPVERHVRFAGLPDSGSDSDETDENHDNFFPDIFVTQDSLDPNFRREIERDGDEDSDVSLNYWDQTGAAEFDGFSDAEPHEMDLDGMDMDGILFADDDDVVARMSRMLPGPDVSSFSHSLASAGADNAAQSIVPDVPLQEDDEDSNGYESDGETTEEDEPVPMRVKIQTSRRRSTPGGSSDSEGGQDGKSGDTKRRAAQLPVRSRKKPICVLNPHTRKMMIFTPQKKRNLEISPGQLPFDYFSMPTTTDSSPIKPNYASFNIAGQWPADALMVPQLPFAEDMFVTDPMGIGPASESSSLPGEEEDAEENGLDINDFISFGDGGSDVEAQDDDNADEGNNDDGVETPSRRPSDFMRILDHFDKRPNAVGAFRLNQTHQKLILNGEATQESLAFSNPYFHGTLRGIKDGSLGGAATPLTPERRRKKKALAKSPAEAAAMKRKASGMSVDAPRAHKKQRSISDVSGMQT